MRVKHLAAGIVAGGICLAVALLLRTGQDQTAHAASPKPAPVAAAKAARPVPPIDKATCL